MKLNYVHNRAPNVVLLWFIVLHFACIILFTMYRSTLSLIPLYKSDNWYLMDRLAHYLNIEFRDFGVGRRTPRLIFLADELRDWSSILKLRLPNALFCLSFVYDLCLIFWCNLIAPWTLWTWLDIFWDLRWMIVSQGTYINGQALEPRVIFLYVYFLHLWWIGHLGYYIYAYCYVWHDKTGTK